MNDSLQHTPDTIQAQLQRILSGPRFLSSPQLCSFLSFVVEETLAGRAQRIKQYTIAVKAFGRNPDFNPEADPIVRIEARRLRRALDRYYREQGVGDPIRIAIPVGAYVPAFGPNQPQADDSTRETPALPLAKMEPAMTLPRGPSILVLPLDVLTHDQEQSYFADGLTEQLAVALMVYPDFLIIGPLSRDRLKSIGPTGVDAMGQRYGARFVLHGSLRKGGDSVRIMVNLIDVVTRGTLWAKTFDGNLNAADLFEFEDAVASEVASTLADNFGIIPRTLARQALEKRTDSLEAYDAILRWSHYFTALTEEAWNAAYEALEHAVQADPNYALTHAMLADMYGTRYHLRGGDEGVLEQMQGLVGRALELDPRCQLAHQLKAMVHFFRGRRDLFLDEAEWTVELNPNNSNIIASCGLFVAIVGEWEHGLALLEKAMRLNPHYPGWYHLGPFLNLYRKGAYGESLQEAMRINLPSLYLDPLGRAAALGQLGRLKEAATALDELERMLPKTGIGLPELMRRTLFSDDNVEMLLDGLHKVGWEPLH